MRFRRILAAVMAMALLAAPALAEGGVGAEGEKQALTILLVDCGVALYGAEPFEGSVALETGDPAGLTLSLAQGAGDIIGDGYVLVMGYDSILEDFGEQPVPASDGDAIARQVKSIRELREATRLSSDVPGALNALCDLIVAKGWNQAYDVRLILMTGGCVNNRIAEPYDSAAISSSADRLRAAGVTIRAFGFDLSGMSSGERLIASYHFESGEYTAIAVGEGGLSQALREGYIPRVAETLAQMGGWLVEPLDRVKVQPDDLAVVVTDADVRVLSGSDPEVGAGGNGLRLYHERVVLPLELAKERLDADGDGVMDISPIDLGDRRQALIDGLLDLSDGIQATSGDENVVTLDMVADLLGVTGVGGGSATITFTSPAQPGETLTLAVSVIDRNVYFEEIEGALTPGERDIVLARAAAGLEGTLERKSGEAWAAVEEGAALTCDGQTLSARFDVPGTYRVIAWTADGDQRYNVTSREYNVRVEIDPISDVALVYPYFRHQPGQAVKLTSRGEALDISPYTVVVEPADAARVYRDYERGELFIEPLKAGKATVAIIDSDGAQAAAFNVGISPLTGGAAFWIFAALIPVGLIGVGLCLGLILGGKRRR